VTQRITTGHHHARVDGIFTQQRRHIVRAMHQPEPMDPPILPGRQLDDALGLWPSRRERGITCKARCINVIQSDLALVCVVLQRFPCPCGLGQGGWVSEALERFSPPLPSQTGLCGQAWQRRQPEALGGWVGEALHHPVERLGRFLDVLQGDGLCRRAACARSAAARCIMPTLGARLFPGLDPGRPGDTMDLRGPGDGLERRALGTQSQTMSTAPGSKGGSILHRVCSALTWLFCQRLHISHDYSLIRLYESSHEKLCSVDEIEDRHCVKKLLVGYLST
jgi:hypothetical protein